MATSTPLQISGEQESELVNMLSQAIEYHQSAAKPFLEKSQAWLEMFNVVPTTKDKPWPGASNFVVPFLAEKLMSIHARLVRAIFNVDPVWVAKARMPEVREAASYVETYVDYLVDRGGYKPTLDMAILYALIEGTSVVKVDY